MSLSGATNVSLHDVNVEDFNGGFAAGINSENKTTIVNSNFVRTGGIGSGKFRIAQHKNN